MRVRFVTMIEILNERVCKLSTERYLRYFFYVCYCVVCGMYG